MSPTCPEAVEYRREVFGVIGIEQVRAVGLFSNIAREHMSLHGKYSTYLLLKSDLRQVQASTLVFGLRRANTS